MKISELQTYKKILILGYGKEGRATHEYLKAKLPHLTVDIADKSISSDYLEKQKEYDLVIKTPGISHKLITVPYTTATNIFFANTPQMIIGVTGSKGKTTTASLIYTILKTAGLPTHLVGNIGNPALLEALKPIGKEDIFVYELSSYQLEDIQYSPHIAIITSLFPEHMDYHGSVEKYYKAKENIIRFMQKGDYYVYSQSYQTLVKWIPHTPAQAVPFTAELEIKDNETHLVGNHNKENIRAAITVAKLLNIPEEVSKIAISSFMPVRHRLQKVGTFKDITFYDSAISVVPESTMLDIKSFPQIGTIFLGGTNRGYDFTELVSLLIEKKIPNIVFFPESGKKILEELKKHSSILPRILETSSMEEAVKFAYQYSPKGTICLLSTASPSYSLWKNFEEKGDLFQKFVKAHGTS